MKKINKLAAATLISTFGLFSAGSAIAADYTAGPSGHWYVEGLVGGALPLKRDVTVNGAPGTYKPQGGFTGAATVGHTFGDNLRVELAGSWTRANKGTVVLAGTPFPHAGSIDVYTLMVNGLVSFDIGSVVRPFVGVGAGFAVFNMNNFGASPGAFAFNDSDTVAAGALHAGLDVPLGDSGVTFTGRYSLVATGQANFTATDGINTSTKPSGVDHVFLAGVRVPLGR
ncbi:MAG: outer membrane beta-barrel protein [Rhodobiaceae bacterium]|nr:outer membrane beta-barrel protein [Rhodobiaceae bacterium]